MTDIFCAGRVTEDVSGTSARRSANPAGQRSVCRPQDMERVAKATGGAVQNTCSDLIAEVMGKCGNFEEVQVGAERYNLRGIDLELPLNTLTCVTGVSGSGKSTLIREVLFENLKATLARTRGRKRLVGCRGLEGWQVIDRALEVDQTPIGKTPRSCPATYIGVWDEVRRLFSKTPEAR